MESTNACQSGTERQSDSEEENEGQDVNLNVSKARKKMLFYARAEIALNKSVTQSKCRSLRGGMEKLCWIQTGESVF